MVHDFCFACFNWKLHDLYKQKWQTQKKSVWFPAVSQLQPARCFELEEREMEDLISQ